jgi:glycosyltransferase involved in cell wall biosynthesis/O-antigen/teichoic acid export membrane protein
MDESSARPGRRTQARHILILTDRDWTHPEGGGTGTNLYGQVAHWIAWGHRVTVISGSYKGAERVQRLGPQLELHHMGTRLTVFPRAAWAVMRGLGRDADVVLEVINGIAFFTPLWLRRPRVALVHHVHREHYVFELGRRGAIGALLLETIPLRFLYRETPFITISEAAREDLIAVGVPREHVHVAYLGVDHAQFHRSPRAAQPTLLYLGRLKRYKRVEHVLDALDAIPAARLHIAGDGDHRPALEAAIEERGLTDRVQMHGFVDEAKKVELYGSAWLNLTASSVEGWCLTVMEAAACGTPTAALRVGGLPEAIVEGETGVLADDVPELAERSRVVIDDPALRERLGDAAEARARGFTWDRTAEDNFEVLERVRDAETPSLRAALMRSDTLKAAGLAAAAMGANGIQAIFTVLFAHLLGVSHYGSLARLVTTVIILQVPGAALQVAVARETALGKLGDSAQQAATLRKWTRQLVIAMVAVTVGAVLLRDPLASLIRVDQPIAAAATIPTACAWLLLSIQRGALQGQHAYAPVGLSILGESMGRLLFSLALALAGLGVTGVFFGTPLAMLAVSFVLAILLRRRLDPPAERESRTLSSLARGAWAPVAGLTLVFLLQNMDVIVVRYQFGKDPAGAYAGAAVAAKLAIWVAIGIAVYVIPEAARRAASGLDPRPVLARSLAIVASIALPCLAIFAAASTLLLRLAFGEKFVQASSALILLGAAMSLLAVAYLAVQYMLALFRFRFLFVLAIIAAIEPLLLTGGVHTLEGFAALVLAIQCAAAVSMLALSLRARTSAARPAHTVGLEPAD